MKKKRSELLTEVELEFMNELWALGEGTVRDVLERLPEDRNLAYTSGATILRILEQKEFVTSRKAQNKAQKFQLIWPYSDFLLHDMGEGLADHQPVGAANGREWRTPPLWGIGLTETVSGHTFFLHDGRARNLTEALLWHGGEAQDARDIFANMARSERNALITFLESL